MLFLHLLLTSRCIVPLCSADWLEVRTSLEFYKTNNNQYTLPFSPSHDQTLSPHPPLPMFETPLSPIYTFFLYAPEGGVGSST